MTKLFVWINKKIFSARDIFKVDKLKNERWYLISSASNTRACCKSQSNMLHNNFVVTLIAIERQIRSDVLTQLEVINQSLIAVTESK